MLTELDRFQPLSGTHLSRNGATMNFEQGVTISGPPDCGETLSVSIDTALFALSGSRVITPIRMLVFSYTGTRVNLIMNRTCHHHGQP